jgi:hypothetical protein
LEYGARAPGREELGVLMAEVIERVEVANVIGLIAKVQTLATGGFRIWIDGTTQDIAQAAFLMPFADTPGALMEITFYDMQPVKQERSSAKSGNLAAGSKRKSKRTPAQISGADNITDQGR